MKNILVTGGAGFIGSNLAFYFQEKFPQSHIVILDCFRSEVTLSNGNLQSFGHYKNLIGFKGDLDRPDLIIDWTLLLSISAIAIGGIFVGIYLTRFIDGTRLKKGFGWFVLAMAVYIILKQI